MYLKESLRRRANPPSGHHFRHMILYDRRLAIYYLFAKESRPLKS